MYDNVDDDDDDDDDDCDDSSNCPNFKTIAMKLTNQIFHVWRRDFQPRNPALFPVPLSNKRFGGRAWFLLGFPWGIPMVGL